MSGIDLAGEIPGDELSNAIVLYLGAGTSSFPRPDMDRLVQAFGGEKAARVHSRIERLLREVDAVHVDWAAHSLVSAGDMMKREMQRRHPWLSAAACSALAWKFTFDWR